MGKASAGAVLARSARWNENPQPHDHARPQRPAMFFNGRFTAAHAWKVRVQSDYTSIPFEPVKTVEPGAFER